MNDPVGLIRWKDEWRMSFIAAPDSTALPSSWGVSVSKDLLNWQNQESALEGDDASSIYSGSAVAHAGEVYAFFTRHDPHRMLQRQELARSSGDLTVWTLDPKNPLIDEDRRDSRDPFVFRWGEEWRMLLAEPVGWHSATEGRSRLVLHASDDLVAWRSLGDFGPAAEAEVMYECPSLIAMTDPAGNPHWLLMVSIVDRRNNAARCSTVGWLGAFDGLTFTPTGGPTPVDYGPDFYAAAPWANLGNEDPLITAWMNSWAYARALPCEGWAGGPHTLPRRLSLAVDDADVLQVRQAPAATPRTLPFIPLSETGVSSDLGHPLPKGCVLRLRGPAVDPRRRPVITLALGGLEQVHLRLEADQNVLSREGPVATALERGFAGQWACPRQPTDAIDLTLVIDGCALEVFDAATGRALSMLLLRQGEGRIRLDGLGPDLTCDLGVFPN